MSTFRFVINKINIRSQFRNSFTYFNSNKLEKCKELRLEVNTLIVPYCSYYTFFIYFNSSKLEKLKQLASWSY